jgi:carbamoyltransferase
MAGAFLGPSYRNDEIQDVLNKYNAVYKNMTLEEIYNITSKAIIDGKIIGWYQGRTEYGPRALGNRSILANATLPETQKKLNLKIKYRESFRPFACSILREDLDKYFDTDYNSNYMLLVYHVKESRRNKVNDENLFGIDKLNVQRSDVPAITHINFSTRIHTVCREDNPIYYDMIKQYKKDSGCSLIVNTSFNVRGEPIVNTPEDAFKCFMNTEMDMLVLSNYILNKGDQKGVKVEKQNFEAD